MGRDPIGACCTHGPSQSCPPTRARFQNLAQETQLLGQIAAALLLQGPVAGWRG